MYLSQGKTRKDPLKGRVRVQGVGGVCKDKNEQEHKNAKIDGGGKTPFTSR